MSDVTKAGAEVSAAAIQHDVYRLVNEGEHHAVARFDLALVDAVAAPDRDTAWSTVDVAVPAGTVTTIGLAVEALDPGASWGVEVGHLVAGGGQDPDDRGPWPSLLTNAMSLGNVGATDGAAALHLTVRHGSAERFGLPAVRRLTVAPGGAVACALRFTPVAGPASSDGADAPQVAVDFLDGQPALIVGRYGALGPAASAISVPD